MDEKDLFFDGELSMGSLEEAQLEEMLAGLSPEERVVLQDMVLQGMIPQAMEASPLLGEMNEMFSSWELMLEEFRPQTEED